MAMTDIATTSQTGSTGNQPASSTRQNRPRKGRQVGAYAIRIALVVLFAFPLVFMVVSALKPDRQIFADLESFRAFLPVGEISLDNFVAVFDRVPAARFLMNSVLVSIATVTLGIIVNSMAAFVLSRMRIKGAKVILMFIIATLILPFETLALPLLWWINKLPHVGIYSDGIGITQGLMDTYQVQILPFVANAFSIYLFHQYFESIPRELDEAAAIDGAGWFRIYSRVVMPLAGPAIATVAILTLLPAWNSYLWPLMAVQSEELRPVMVGVQYFFQLSTSWGQVMAYATVITLPVIILFVCFQRAFVSSIAASGVKG